MNKTVELEQTYHCQNCDENSEESAGPLYECGNCGTIFNRDSANDGGHQCPSCYKFGSRIADDSCPQCNEGELDEVYGFRCSCHEEFHTVDV